MLTIRARTQDPGGVTTPIEIILHDPVRVKDGDLAYTCKVEVSCLAGLLPPIYGVDPLGALSNAVRVASGYLEGLQAKGVVIVW